MPGASASLESAFADARLSCRPASTLFPRSFAAPARESGAAGDAGDKEQVSHVIQPLLEEPRHLI
jgi:hypothetical protein